MGAGGVGGAGWGTMKEYEEVRSAERRWRTKRVTNISSAAYVDSGVRVKETCGSFLFK